LDDNPSLKPFLPKALDEAPGDDSGAFVIRTPPLQPRRGDLSGLGGFVCDLSGPPAAVGVLDGGSLAGNDSSSSSSSLSSGFDCGLVGGDFRGSFIPASPWGPRALIGLKLQRP
jgi:hypothetical protein